MCQFGGGEESAWDIWWGKGRHVVTEKEEVHLNVSGNSELNYDKTASPVTQLQKGEKEGAGRDHRGGEKDKKKVDRRRGRGLKKNLRGYWETLLSERHERVSGGKRGAPLGGGGRVKEKSDSSQPHGRTVHGGQRALSFWLVDRGKSSATLGCGKLVTQAQVA